MQSLDETPSEVKELPGFELAKSRFETSLGRRLVFVPKESTLCIEAELA
jgi:hypothetical protein